MNPEMLRIFADPYDLLDVLDVQSDPILERGSP